MTSVVASVCGGGGHVGAEVHDAHVARAERAAALGDRARVRERQPRRAERALDRRAAAAPVLGDAEHVAAVDADHQRRADPRAADRVAGGRRVVRVDEVEREAPSQARSASASVGAAHAPQAAYERGRGGATNGT